MTSQSFCIFLLVVFPFPAVFCKYDYSQHIHSHNHKGHSTKEALSSTTAVITTPEEVYSSKQDDVSSEEISSSEDIHTRKHKENETILQKGDPYSDQVQYKFVARIGIIVGSVVIIVACLGCIVCCCPSCCRGKDQRGFIIRNAVDDREVEACPQHIVNEIPAQQPVIVQHFPPQYTQDTVQQFPPQYQQPVPPQSQYPPAQPFSQYSPVQPTSPYSPEHPTSPQYSPFQPGYQYSNTNVQFYNPPEAPPPYEATAPSK